MQENNFEKQVQQELDGLRLNPSADVWLNVEASLKKKKDRRVLVLLLSFVFFAGAGLLTYNFYQTGSTIKQPELSAAQGLVKNEQPPSVASTSSADSIGTTAATIPPSETPASASKQKKPSSLLVVAPQTSQAITDNNASSTAVNDKTLLYKTAKIRRYIGTKTAVQTDGAIIETIDDEAEATSLPPMQRIPFNLSGVMENSTKQDLHLSINLINAKNLTKKGISSPRLEAVSNIAKAAGKKLNISFEAGIGRSGTANSYLGTIPNNLYYDASTLSNAVGTGGQVPDSLRPYNINPSALKTGAGFFVGILFTKKIAGRSSLSAGVRYQLLTTSQAVGASLSSPAYNAQNGQRQEAVYKAGITNSHTNSYHFIQIPVEFNTQLTGFKQHNIFLETGISFSQLIHTNALQFNNVTRQYFKDNSFFNKTTVGFSSGVFVNLRKDNKPSLLLGPSFQYSFTPLAAEGLYAKSRYSFLGLRVQKAIGKK